MANMYNKSAGWRFANSLMFIFFLFPWCFPWPFIIMAGKTQNKKYRRLGYVYFFLGTATLISWFALVTVETDSPELRETWAVLVWILAILIHIFAMAQAVILHNSYLTELADIESGGNYNNMNDRGLGIYGQQATGNGYVPPAQGPYPGQYQSIQPVRQNMGAPVTQGVRQNVPVQPKAALSKAPAFPAGNAMGRGAAGAAVYQGPKLNINTASEEELAALPGLNIIDAKKAGEYRNYHGDFNSVEQFISLLNLKPHIAAPLFDILYCTPSAPGQAPGAAAPNPGRRKIDL
ncbi:MAG: helix-hairpin-helix domain-containing protein [Ruminococcus sp.]|nr:helix-hairpin-helix domain-containing protein [Ruminococcus sp.]